MSGIDRRGLLKGAVAGAALIGVPASLKAMSSTTSLFIYDGRFEEAKLAAKQWQAKGVETLDGQANDLGHAWRGMIADRLSNGGTIEGMTMWVDSFICETFGRDLGMKIARAPIDAGQQLHQWVLQ
jgi:hypothetical protein